MAKKSKGAKKKKSPKKTERERAHKKEKKAVSRPGSRQPKFNMARILLAHLPSWYPLPLFILIGLFFRLSVIVWEPLVFPDSTQYIHLAGEIKSGVFFDQDFDLDQGFIKSRKLPLLYPLLLAPFANTDIDLEYAGVSISLFMSILTFIPLYLVAAMIFSRRIAIISSALISFHSFILMYSTTILTEATFSALYMGLIAISAYCLIRPSFGLFIICGILSSLLYMTRDVGISAVFIIALGALIKLGLIDRIARLRLLGFLLALVVSFLVVSTPYFVHIRARTGSWGLSSQMSGAGITRQIQRFGGDRRDRDRSEKNRIGTKLIGGEVAKGVLDLAKLSPALSVKLIKNMGLYGRELIQRWGTLVFAFIIIGLMGIIRDYVRDRDRVRLFMEVWLVVWVIQLLALYSLVTEYMVDYRYMYSLMFPGLILAGRGICTASGWFQELLRDKAKTDPGDAIHIQAFVFPAALVFFLYVLPWCMLPKAVQNYNFFHSSSTIPVYFFPLAGLVVLFGLAMAPGASLAFGSWFSREGSNFREKAIVLGLLLAGLAALWAPKLVPPLIKYLPGLVLAGAGLALAPRLIWTGRLVKAESFSMVLSALLVAITFFAQWPDFVEIQDRTSPKYFWKYMSAGYKQAAAEIKARGLVPPGKVICARKPFIAFYLDGKFNGDGKTRILVPKTVSEVKELIRSGSIDYLAADTNTDKYKRPQLTELSFGLLPLPGARIIYSSYFQEFRNIITVYDCHQSEPPLPDRGSSKNHLLAARDFYKAGKLPFAYREAQRASELDLNNRDAWHLMFQILDVYYKLTRTTIDPTRIRGPNVLSSLYRVEKELVRLNPGHPESKTVIEKITRIRKLEEKMEKEFNQKRKKK